MTVPEAVEHEEREINLLPVLYEHPAGEATRAAAGSVFVHLVIALVLLTLPASRSAPDVRPIPDFRRATPLIAPPPQLTQTAPNRGPVSKEFDLEGLLARQGVRTPVPPRRSPPPGFRLPPAPKPGVPAPPRIEEAPQIAQQLPQGPANLPGTQLEAPPPQIQPQERAKLAFEPVGTPMTNQRPATGLGRVARPSASVGEAIREVARGGGGGSLVVEDLGDLNRGSIGEGIVLGPSRPKTGSTLELLSDPKGIDFRPYLIRVLAAVRRNWFAVIPESAHLGRRGRVQVQFAISRDGNVPKLVIALPSGTDSLDRAAVAGISASNPFPPLPAGYTGDQIRLQLTFLYNVRP
jgi:TonB family protein